MGIITIRKVILVPSLPKEYCGVIDELPSIECDILYGPDTGMVVLVMILGDNFLNLNVHSSFSIGKSTVTGSPPPGLNVI